LSGVPKASAFIFPACPAEASPVPIDLLPRRPLLCAVFLLVAALGSMTAPPAAAQAAGSPKRADGTASPARKLAPAGGDTRQATAPAKPRKASRAAASADRAPRAANPARAARPVGGRDVAHASTRARTAVATSRVSAVTSAAPARLSVGQSIGLHAVDDPLDLHSSVALLADQATGEVLFAKNADAVLPIASITKVMTAMVVLDAALPLDEILEISTDDIDTEKGSRSRLRPGTRLSRAELLHLALMASENRAAHALGRHYPGGLEAFVAAMNAKARQIGMLASRFNDPTGLSGRNMASARDLARMMQAAYDYPLVRQYSVSPELQVVAAGEQPLRFRNTNRLIDQASWSIGLQKTGYISEAGRCLIMQVALASRSVLMVLLDSSGRHSRYGDAQRLRDWLESSAGSVRGAGRLHSGQPVFVNYAAAGSTAGGLRD
jgi:D-alanyl-D-alanine endopeptidase (penicillin-binding protein 7)